MACQVPVTGMEYTIIPDGNPYDPDLNPGAPSWCPPPGSMEPYTWTTVGFDGNTAAIPVGGFNIQSRYRLVNYSPAVPGVPDPITGLPGPGTEESYTYTYPSWELISQTLTLTNRSNAFENPSDNFYGAPPGVYGTAVSGIKGGEKYVYVGVFDQTITNYIERLEPYDSTPVRNKVVPTEPYDPDNNIYPIDTLTFFKPDPRSIVTLNYKMVTLYEYAGGTRSDTINIIHNVFQSINNWGEEVNTLVDRAHFTQGRIPVKGGADIYVER